MGQPPKLSVGGDDPLSEYYSDGERRYAVSRLIEEAKGLDPFDAQDMARHLRRVMDADLSKPIILDWDGCIADGRHRVVKAILEGHRTIKAVRLMERMSSDGSAKKDADA